MGDMTRDDYLAQFLAQPDEHFLGGFAWYIREYCGWVHLNMTFIVVMLRNHPEERSDEEMLKFLDRSQTSGIERLLAVLDATQEYDRQKRGDTEVTGTAIDYPPDFSTVPDDLFLTTLVHTLRDQIMTISLALADLEVGLQNAYEPIPDKEIFRIHDMIRESIDRVIVILNAASDYDRQRRQAC